MTNFERAHLRMRRDGYRPFTPDRNTATSRRVLRDTGYTQAEPPALLIDKIIGHAGAIGLAVTAIIILVEKALT